MVNELSLLHLSSPLVGTLFQAGATHAATLHPAKVHQAFGLCFALKCTKFLFVKLSFDCACRLCSTEASSTALYLLSLTIRVIVS